jgi:hypothetical protein
MRKIEIIVKFIDDAHPHLILYERKLKEEWGVGTYVTDPDGKLFPEENIDERLDQLGIFVKNLLRNAVKKIAMKSYEQRIQ